MTALCTFTHRGVTCGLPTRLIIAGPLATQLIGRDKQQAPIHAVQQDERWRNWIARGLPDHDAQI